MLCVSLIDGCRMACEQIECVFHLSIVLQRPRKVRLRIALNAASNRIHCYYSKLLDIFIMDAKDKFILELLRGDAEIPLTEIAARAHLDSASLDGIPNLESTRV